MKITFRLPLILVLATNCCLALSFHGNVKFVKKIPLSYSGDHNTDSLDLIKKQIGGFAKKKDYKNAIVLSKKLLQKAQQQLDSNYITNALWRQAFYFKNMDQLDSAYFYFDKSYVLNLKLKDSIGAGDRLMDMANIQKSLGDFNGGMITATEGLKYLEGTEEIESICGLYQTIAVCQKELGHYTDALRWSNKIFTLLKTHTNHDVSETNLYVLKNTRANILALLGKFPKSLSILDSIAHNTKDNDPTQYARAICNMGHYKWMQNPHNPESEVLLLNSLQIRQQLNSIPGLISSNIHLAEFYFENHKPKALAYAENALNHSIALNNPVAILESLDLILPLKNALGQDVSEEAIYYSKVQNNLEKTKQAVRAIYAATKYDNDTLEKKNLTLLAQVAIKEKQNILALSASLILLILIIFVVYYKNQQKKREQLETAYKTELRLSKKLHDELGNDIFYLMTQIQNENKEMAASKDPQILEGLDSIYKRVRDISKEFTAIDIGVNFGKEFFALLNSYGSPKTKIITKELATDYWNEVPAATKIEVFRVLQELLVNMKKHSNASLVAITCSQNKKQFNIKYVDNGVGFSPNENYSGNGIKNVENRMKGINGNITFDSKPNKGVSANITFTV